MSAWDAYPDHYREKEVRQILSAVHGGECAAVIGLSGAGKSNLIGFIAHRAGAPGHAGNPSFVLVDGNRAQPRTVDGLFGLMRTAVEGSTAQQTGGISELQRLEGAVRQRLDQQPGGLCLLIDRYDALSPEERGAAAGPLRALRDMFKYQFTFVITARRPPDASDELAELFYANTIWLGPLSVEDARWSANQYAGRRGAQWDEYILSKLISASWGYPALLRACCEAYASGAPLEIDALRAHPAVQRRVQEFWADGPIPEDLRRSGLAGQPLLSAAQPVVSAESPELTASEHRLLACFQAHPGEVCGKDDLIRAVWPEDRVIDGLRDDSLAQLIRRLRQKIGAERIQTIPGRGYRFVS